jgi:hypothetical protein
MRPDDLEIEWDDLLDILEASVPVRGQRPFSPTHARAFAEALVCLKSVDEARVHTLTHPEEAEAFASAAHFAVAFVRGGVPAVSRKSDTDREPFLLIASAVLNLLDRLEHEA